MNEKLLTIKACTELGDKLTDYIEKNTAYLDTMNITVANNAYTVKNMEQKNFNFYIKVK